MSLSLFTEDGHLISGKKFDFMHKFEELVPGEKDRHINACDAAIFYGHSVIQMLTPPSTSNNTITFRDMVTRFLKHIM